MADGSTIAAIGTAPGASAGAMVRVSGPLAREVARTLLGDGEREDIFGTARGCAMAKIRLPPDAHSRPPAGEVKESSDGLEPSRLGQGLALPARVLWFCGPGSYTGEDTLELVIPGNPLVVRRVMGVVLQIPGVRHAAAGEFSARAYLNGRLTLEQAEGVAAGIAAQSAAELAAARDLASGRTGEAYRALAEEIANLLALIEAGIDFTDQEDVRAISPEVFDRRVRGLLAMLERMGEGGQVRTIEPLVVLAGAPNAGKSTLFNALLGRERAIAAPVAGTTRDVLIEPLILDDGARRLAVRLADVAGLDECGAGGDIAREAAAKAQETIAAADLVVWCEPGHLRAGFGGPRRCERPEAGDLGAGVSGLPRELCVRTFADRPALDAARKLEVCALDGFGLASLRRAIIQRLVGSRSASAAALVSRHAEALRQTRLALAESLASDQPETIAQSLRMALDSIGEIAGRISPDDVLGRVFSRFCVGK